MVKKIQINLSNKVYYTLVVIGLIVLFGIVVYATAPNPGHTWEEIECIDCIDAGDIGSIGDCSNICTDRDTNAKTLCGNNQYLRGDSGPTVCQTADQIVLGAIGQILVKGYNSKESFFIRSDYPEVSFGPFPNHRIDFYCDFRLSGGSAQIRARAGAGCIGSWVASTQQAECTTGGGSMRCRLGREEMWGDSAPGGTDWKNLWDPLPFNFRPF